MKKINLKKNWRFLLFNTLFVLAFFGPLRNLVQMSMSNDTFTYIPFIPIISAYLIYEKRQNIFPQERTSSPIGLLAIGIGFLLLFANRNHEAMSYQHDYLTLMAASMVLIWVGGFTFCYGTRSLLTAVFPLLFLFFMVPFPSNALNKIVLFLQKGSAEAAYGFFKASGIPVSREGFVFHSRLVRFSASRMNSLPLADFGCLAALLPLRCRSQLLCSRQTGHVAV